MIRRVFIFSCLAVLVYSACTPYGPAIGGKCPSTKMTIQYGLGKAVDPFNVGICVDCSTATNDSSVPQGCTPVGPAIGGKCPLPSMKIQHGLGQAADPFNAGICMQC